MPRRQSFAPSVDAAAGISRSEAGRAAYRDDQPDARADILRDEIFNEANAFFEDDTLLELARKMGAINTQRAFLPAPFVTIVLEV